MDVKETLTALERLKVETGSLACLGCGYEHNCGIHGCAIIRSAAELLQMTAHTFPEPALLELAAQYLDTAPERLRELMQAEKSNLGAGSKICPKCGAIIGWQKCMEFIERQ